MFAIDFPPATTQSKLSACPTEKIPQTTDWIYQDFFNTVLAGDHATFTTIPTLASLFPHEKSYLPYYKEHLLERQHSLFKNLRSGDDNQSMLSISSEDEEEEIENEVASDSDASYRTTNSSIASTYEDMDNAAILADMVPPVLIESTISSQLSCSTLSLSSTSTKEGDVDERASTAVSTTTVTTTNKDDLLCVQLSKRKSTSSLHSFKTIMSDVFHSNKKTKLSHHPHHLSSPPSPLSATPPMNDFYVPQKKQSTTSMAKSVSKRLFKYFKHHRYA